MKVWRCSLSQLAPGHRATVVYLSSFPEKRRLMEMGLLPGGQILVVARYPFRGPVIVQAGGVRLAMDRCLEHTIWVERTGSMV